MLKHIITRAAAKIAEWNDSIERVWENYWGDAAEDVAMGLLFLISITVLYTFVILGLWGISRWWSARRKRRGWK